MKTLILSLALPAALAAQGPPKTFTGVITDTMCGKDHKHMGATDEAKCVRDCVRSGQYKYALLTGNAVYVLSDQRAPEKFAAQKVRVTGVLHAKTKILRLDRIEAAR